MPSSNLTTRGIKSSLGKYQLKLAEAALTRGLNADIGDVRSGELVNTYRGVRFTIAPTVVRPSLQDAISTLAMIAEAANPPAQGGMSYIEEARIGVRIDSASAANVLMERAQRGLVAWDDAQEVESM